MVTVRQRRPEKAVTRAGAGRGWGEEVSQTTGGGLWQSYYNQCLYLVSSDRDSKTITTKKQV